MPGPRLRGDRQAMPGLPTQLPETGDARLADSAVHGRELRETGDARLADSVA